MRAPLRPTADGYAALARSSPWRWRALHFRHTHARRSVEAWVHRPGRLTVRHPEHGLEVEDGLPYTSSVLTTSGGVPVENPTPDQVRPVLRADGLVAERPSSFEVDYDDPMYGSFTWVAMLDPVELSHHVAISDVAEVEVAGRPAWSAYLVAEQGYEPRCGGNCCELLVSDVGRLCEAMPDPPPVPDGLVYPEGYRVTLDLATGVVVRLRPVGGSCDDLWFDLEVLAVDDDVAALAEVRR